MICFFLLHIIVKCVFGFWVLTQQNRPSRLCVEEIMTFSVRHYLKTFSFVNVFISVLCHSKLNIQNKTFHLVIFHIFVSVLIICISKWCYVVKLFKTFSVLNVFIFCFSVLCIFNMNMNILNKTSEQTHRLFKTRSPVIFYLCAT